MEAVTKLISNARAIALDDPSTPNGIHLDRMLEDLGIADKVRPKLIAKAPIQGGAELVAKGDADVGLYLLSEVQNAEGVTLVGSLPLALQNFIVYGAAIPATNNTPKPALAFIEFLKRCIRSSPMPKGVQSHTLLYNSNSQLCLGIFDGSPQQFR